MKTVDYWRNARDNAQLIEPKPEIFPDTELHYPATHPESFFTAIYHCVDCNYSSDIYIANDYDLFGSSNADDECNICKHEEELICDGDLIFRKDWPRPDDDPWQMQFAYLPTGTGYCKECEPKHKTDYRSLRPSCPKCEGEMAYQNNDEITNGD